MDIETEFTPATTAAKSTLLPSAKFIEKLAAQGTSPSLTWYGMNPSGAPERIELSGKVCLNHLAKISNYLSSEFGTVSNTEIEASSTDFNPPLTTAPAKILFDLPPHWKSILWVISALGANIHPYLVAQASCITDQDGNDSGSSSIAASYFSPKLEQLVSELDFGWGDAVVTNNPELWEEFCEETGAALLALNLSSLALSWGADLSEEIIDAAAEVLGQPDAFMFEFGAVSISAAAENLPAPDASSLDAPQTVKVVGSLEQAIATFFGLAETNNLPAILVDIKRETELARISSQETLR